MSTPRRPAGSTAPPRRWPTSACLYPAPVTAGDDTVVVDGAVYAVLPWANGVHRRGPTLTVAEASALVEHVPDMPDCVGDTPETARGTGTAQSSPTTDARRTVPTIGSCRRCGHRRTEVPLRTMLAAATVARRAVRLVRSWTGSGRCTDEAFSAAGRVQEPDPRRTDVSTSGPPGPKASASITSTCAYIGWSEPPFVGRRGLEPRT
jgi:hypothetical protein